MSKIFDALKRAELLRAKRKEYTDRRLTGRIQVQIPLFVYGYTLTEDPFCEDTCTVVINANGGLMSMHTPVRRGQRLLMTNGGNEQTQEGVVVSVGAQGPGGMDVAFRFPSPTPQFWSNSQIVKRVDP
jgi:hypothetical protein